MYTDKQIKAIAAAITWHGMYVNHLYGAKHTIETKREDCKRLRDDYLNDAGLPDYDILFRMAHDISESECA